MRAIGAISQRDRPWLQPHRWSIDRDEDRLVIVGVAGAAGGNRSRIGGDRQP
jgi:hypothetical protein